LGAHHSAVHLRPRSRRPRRPAREAAGLLRRRQELIMSESAAARRSAETFLFPPPPVVTLPVEGEAALFPVGRIFCIGRNYAAHAVEMGHDPNKEPPFFFCKHPSNLNVGRTFRYPGRTSDVHHEIEMVVALHKGGSDIAVADALDHV